jgi:hypothetical protein
MRPFLRRVTWILVGALTLFAVLLFARLIFNFAHSEARDTQPLRDLAARGGSPVRDAARAGLAVMDSAKYFGGPIEWVAVIDRRPHGDTVVLGLYRAEDATVLQRMLMPHPYVSGVVRYDSAHHRLVYAGAGIE